MSSKGKSQAATADDEEEESDDEIYEAPVSDCNDQYGMKNPLDKYIIATIKLKAM